MVKGGGKGSQDVSPLEPNGLLDNTLPETQLRGVHAGPREVRERHHLVPVERWKGGRLKIVN